MQLNIILLHFVTTFSFMVAVYVGFTIRIYIVTNLYVSIFHFHLILCPY